MKLANIKLKDDLRFCVILVVLGILLIIAREPEMFLHPRIWAEEATIFYAFARHHSVWNIFTTAHVGYLTLFNSIVSTLQAKIFSVENAATVSTYFGFLIQLIPIYIISFTVHKFWDSALKKIICTLIIIVVMSPELYLNTTNSHFIFGLITFFIMLIAPSTISKFQKYFFRLLLFIGGLTGPASIFFTPIFLLKAYREKNKEKYIQAGILTFCAIIQASVILYAILYKNTYNRLAVHDLTLTRYRFIIDNFTLISAHAHKFNGQLFSIDLIMVLGLFIGSFYVYLLIKNRKKNDYSIALLSFIIVGVLSTLGSLDMGGGTRYSYIPTCILLIVVTSQFFEPKHNYIALAILIFCLGFNSFYYTNINDWAYKPTYAKWENEVAKWRADTTYKPEVHPAGWKMKL